MHSPFSETAFALHVANYSPLPIFPKTKRPAINAWASACSSAMAHQDIARFCHSQIPYGVGVALGYGGLTAIDIDTDDPAIEGAINDVLTTPTVGKKGRRGATYFYYDANGSVRTRHFAGLVDVLSIGAQTVLPPTTHPTTGQPYKWLSERTLLNTPVTDLPAIAPDIADRLAAALTPWQEEPRRPAPARSPLRLCELSQYQRERQRAYCKAILRHALPKLASMAPNTGRNDAAYRLVCRTGRWTHHGIIERDQLADAVLTACACNGLVRDDGKQSVVATIESALAKSAGDPLPDLGVRNG